MAALENDADLLLLSSLQEEQILAYHWQFNQWLKLKNVPIKIFLVMHSVFLEKNLCNKWTKATGLWVLCKVLIRLAIHADLGLNISVLQMDGHSSSWCQSWEIL